MAAVSLVQKISVRPLPCRQIRRSLFLSSLIPIRGKEDDDETNGGGKGRLDSALGRTAGEDSSSERARALLVRAPLPPSLPRGWRESRIRKIEPAIYLFRACMLSIETSGVGGRQRG